MSGTFFLVSQWGFETKENTNNGESTEDSTSKNRSNHKEITEDNKSILSSWPTNRAECLIWLVQLAYFELCILSNASFSRNNGAKKHFNKFHAGTVLEFSNWNQMSSREREEKLLTENRSWKEFIRLIK